MNASSLNRENTRRTWLGCTIVDQWDSVVGGAIPTRHARNTNQATKNMVLIWWFYWIQDSSHLLPCDSLFDLLFSNWWLFFNRQHTHSACLRMCEHTFLSSIKTVTPSLTLWLYAVNDASSILNHFRGNVKLFADCNTRLKVGMCCYGRPDLK